MFVKKIISEKWKTKLKLGPKFNIFPNCEAYTPSVQPYDTPKWSSRGPGHFWYLIWMIWDILVYLNLEYVFLPESQTPKTQMRWFLEIWQEPGLGTKRKICANGYITIIKHNIKGTFHGRIQPISWWIIS